MTAPTEPTVEDEVLGAKRSSNQVRTQNTQVPDQNMGPAPDFTGPTIPSRQITPTNMNGREYLQSKVNEVLGSLPGGMWGKAFNQYILGLKPVSQNEFAMTPQDWVGWQEYNKYLAWMQQQARNIESQRDRGYLTDANGKKTAAEKGKFGPKVTDAQGNLVLPQLEDLQKTTPGKSASDLTGTGINQNKPSPGRHPKGYYDNPANAAEWQADREAWQQTVFKGRPIGTDEPQNPSQDSYLNQFLNDEGVHLEGQDSNTALRSGTYVYMGREYSSEYDATRDVFMYVEDAANQLATIDPNTIKEWQAELGNEVTGRIDQDLSTLWNQAVQQAAKYAATKQKVSVRDLMDMYIASAAAGAAKKGGGGGGGRGVGETNPTDQAAVDYYQAMMAVLGDISGVPNAQS